MAAATAATKNNKQKTRRHLNGVKMDVGFGFVIIEWPGRLDYWLLPKPPLLNESAETCQTFSRKL
jgi:hypothetical protein